jgi:hypothetical protein
MLSSQDFEETKVCCWDGPPIVLSVDRLVATWGAIFLPQEAPENFLALTEQDCQQFRTNRDGARIPRQGQNIVGLGMRLAMK